MNLKNFEEINKHIKAADLEQFKVKAASVGGAEFQLCPIYKIVRPILMMVSTLPFFPAKWKEALGIFTSVLDLMCP